MVIPQFKKAPIEATPSTETEFWTDDKARVESHEDIGGISGRNSIAITKSRRISDIETSKLPLRPNLLTARQPSGPILPHPWIENMAYNKGTWISVGLAKVRRCCSREMLNRDGTATQYEAGNIV